ncbi:MAG: diguanylate cyclase proteinuncharacterized domain HDIG-containing protein, partial [Clostridia bacterium]|nr:diguanylate cyclase proteinuncharacterized domain HDIG-containing protein [Clostridia bacterium]
GDVNNLKLTNDIFGHDSGDMLLKKAAEIIKKGCRPEDITARWGGDEFIIILIKTDNEETKEIVDRVKNLFSYEYINNINCSISLGFDTKKLSNDNIMKTIKNAEERMYNDKILDRKFISNNSIKAILKTLHGNSLREEKHAKSVSELCQIMGGSMDLSESESRRLKDVGFLHDIGKIVLDEGLLNKNDTLTDQELQEIKQHPVIGYRILNSFDDTLELAKYVLSHHERWDGTGYPKGLKGEEIPKLARIVALADCFDSMTNGSYYKKVMSIEEAIIEIKNNSGTQFDPEIVKAFIEKVLERILIIRNYKS